MSISGDAIQLLVFLMPGFLAQKVVAYKCDLRDGGWEFYLVEALVGSILIYMMAGAVGVTGTLYEPRSIALLTVLGIAYGIAVGEAKQHDLLSYVFHSKNTRLSTHDKVFFPKATERLFGKWNVIGFHDGRELCGLIREFNSNNSEMLIEQGMWVLPGGSLSEDRFWVYIPPGSGIRYIRTIEG